VIVDGHVTIGRSRDVELRVEELLAQMDRLGVDRTVVAPAEPFVPVRNREGNELVAAAARESGGRLVPYAVATPWLGDEAVEELRRARDGGARALALYPALQGFDLLDGLVDALVEFAADCGWPVYVRSGTPPTGLPLQVAALAQRFPHVAFVLGRSGATDFGQDGPPALAAAGNLYADTAHINWPLALAIARGERRIVFTSDAPFAELQIELARVVESPLAPELRDAILGGTYATLLGL
jgi:predicted TIM-barrel fold metal-dependent hydrolase